MKSFQTLAVGILLLASTSVYSQKYQIAIGAGPSLLYVVEDGSTGIDYPYAMSYQNDFIFLNENGLPNFGFSLNSSSTQKTDSYFYHGRINNTSIMASKYFASSRLFNLITTALEVGGGVNHESFDPELYSFQASNKLMLNLQIGAMLQTEVLPNFLIHAKGLAVGQDVTNIIRYFSTGDWVTAGEDMHLMLLFGFAFEFGKEDQSNR